MGMSYTTGDFYTNGTSGLGATSNGRFIMPKVLPARKPLPVLYQKLPKLEKHTINGVGAMVVKDDFGSMGSMGFSIFGVDVGAEATKLYQNTVSSLQKQATAAVTKQVQNFVVKLTGADGQVKNVTLTPEQAAQYQQTGTLPPSMIPAGFVVPQPSFMDKYGTYVMVGGGILAGLIAIGLIVKMTKK